MAVCSFCSKTAVVGRGVRVFRKDGSSSFFCSHKCECNFKLKRKPSKLKWAKKRS
ncbi:MAG: 50S ribosomal protein L24e [Candidatus Micrarchaeota archaeon]|nr:50S ribosomal protein L24e [Candidatus Micrarchaeota archaeon]